MMWSLFCFETTKMECTVQARKISKTQNNRMIDRQGLGLLSQVSEALKMNFHSGVTPNGLRRHAQQRVGAFRV